jgi:hypothetical protein
MGFNVTFDKASVSRALKKQRQIIDKIETKSHQVLDALARETVNISKSHGRPDTWQDRTGNLRSSINYFLEKVPEGDQAVVSAGMDYAPFVHFRDGYRVLVMPESETIKKYTAILKQL